MALNWTQIIMAAAGTVGFSLIFRLRARYVPLTAVVGALGWAVYLITQQMFQSASVFLPALTGGFAASISSEILARVMKAPSTLFFITSTVPLIPGSTLYYCMDAIVAGEKEAALRYGMITFLIAFGIAMGMSIAWAICSLMRHVAGRSGNNLI